MDLLHESKADDGAACDFACGCSSDLGDRDYQEDGFIVEDNLTQKYGLPRTGVGRGGRALFAVLDGHGGDEMMEFAQQVGEVFTQKSGGVRQGLL